MRETTMNRPRQLLQQMQLPLDDGVRSAAQAKRFQLFRRVMLVLAMLVEAGLPVFPRVPMTGALFVLTGIAYFAMGRSSRRTLPLYLVMVFILLEMALFQEATTPEMLVSRACNFLSAIFLVDIYLRREPDQLGLDLWPLFRFMAIQAIATVALANVSDGLFSSVNWGEYEYRTIAFVLNFHHIATDSFAKADGFFFERGVFQLFLNLYLYFAIFVYRKKVDIVLAAFGVLSTWSTIGVLIMAMLFVLSVVISHGGKTGNQSRMGIVAIVIVLAVPLSNLIVENVQDKLFGTQSSSAEARAFDFNAGLDMVLSNPVVGIGFSNDVFADEFRDRAYLAGANQGTEITDRGMSNGVIRLFLNVGVPIAIVLLIGMFRSRLVPNPMVVGLVLFFSLLSEPIIFCPFVVMIIFSGLISRQKAKPSTVEDMRFRHPAGLRHPAGPRFTPGLAGPRRDAWQGPVRPGPS